MGHFSYIAKNTKEAVSNPWCQEDLCELQLLINGKVVEKMRGIYSGYGSVLTEHSFTHVMLNALGEWIDISEQDNLEDSCVWRFKRFDDIIDLQFGNDEHSGIAAYHVSDLQTPIKPENKRSEDDPYQGTLNTHHSEID